MSPAPVSRVKRPESRRQELLDAALKVFLRKGPATVSVEDVTSAAGAAKGTFYRYFSSRDELTEALRDRFTRAFIAVAAERTGEASAAGWWSQLEAFVECFIEYGVEHRREHEVLFHTVAPPVASGTDGRLVEWLGNFIRSGIGAGAFVVEEPDVTAMLLISASHAVVDAANSGRYEREKLTRALLRIWRKTLQPGE
ncbi:TetR/AcrR family transcriptional regulator [Pseudonocardia spinosispora]|uniref:TetR/AcrR family transcriptional regulator n=1 Tax=Pseudonocardia spinosispora TaxID=103441 RepID=UPI0012EBEA4B|nr:TetR/AcrR family transcriptional regulator [Pseudonocardia spinosispora]